MKNVARGLSNQKSKVDKLDVDKLSDVIKNYVVKKDAYNAKITNIEDKIPGIINLVNNTSLIAGEIPNITNFATNASLNSKLNEV